MALTQVEELSKSYNYNTNTRNIKTIYIRVVIIISVIITLIAGVKYFFYDTYEVPTASMLPLISENQTIIASKAMYMIGEPERCDVIVFRSPEDGEILVKRIIGLPGEQITCIDGEVIINGETIAEDYVKEDWSSWLNPEGKSYAVCELGEDEYFVMGDNRLNSNDSRYFGAISRDSIIAKVYGVES